MASNYEIPKRESSQCCVCKTTTIDVWCDNCRQNYCSKCSEQFHKQRAFLNHQTTNIHEKSSELTRCETHINGELKYWCYTCETLACHGCLKSEHINHKYHSTTEAAMDIQIKLRNKLKELQSSLEHMPEYTIQTAATSESINTKTVTKVFASLRTMLDEQESTLKRKILKIETKNKTLMDEYQTELKFKKESLRHNNTSFESIASANEHIKMLQINEQLTAYLNRFTQELEELKPPIQTEYQVQGLDQLQTSIEENLKQTIVVEQIPEPVQPNQAPVLPPSTLRCGGAACATCHKCTDWKWVNQKKWVRSTNATCSWLHLPKVHPLFPWHYLCHGH